jgi:glucokinase
MILACDVGGTKVNLALYDPSGGLLRRVRLESYPSREAPSLDALLDRFLEATGAAGTIEAAGFGVAGPVHGGRARITNLPWEVDGARLAGRLGLAAVALLNDVEAVAWALEALGPGDVEWLQPGARGEGSAAVVAVGTGIGYSALVRQGRAAASLASEAGHADFAPRTEEEVALWRRLAARHGHVSVERVLSGHGLLEVERHLREARGEPEPAWLAAAVAAGGGPAAVSAAARQGRDPCCVAALELFLGALGAEAGSWALRTLATGGLYLGGGIPAKLLAPEPTDPGWRERAAGLVLAAFLDKGRFRPLLEQVPVGVILDDKAALTGAARRAEVEAREPG